MVKKFREAKFIRISGFVCKYNCSMSCDSGDHAGIGRMDKEIALWYGEQVKSLLIDVNISKEIS